MISVIGISMTCRTHILRRCPHLPHLTTQRRSRMAPSHLVHHLATHLTTCTKILYRTPTCYTEAALSGTCGSTRLFEHDCAPLDLATTSSRSARTWITSRCSAMLPDGTSTDTISFAQMASTRTDAWEVIAFRPIAANWTMAGSFSAQQRSQMQ